MKLYLYKKEFSFIRDVETVNKVILEDTHMKSDRSPRTTSLTCRATRNF